MGSLTSGRSSGEQEYGQARWHATLHAVRKLLNPRSAALVPLEAVRARILVRGQSGLGVQTIPLDRIIGSEGRSSDFDRQFSPRTHRTKERWKSIARAYRQGRTLPPIDVYKLGEVYFVRDGNHRVSVAREQGQLEIEAFVTELKTDVSVQPELTARDLIYLEEQSDFLEWTNLAQVRCSITIQVSQLGGYLDLIGHINRHRAALSAERGHEVDPVEATAHWYDTVYAQVVARLRESKIAQHSRGKTEADIFLAVLKHQDKLAALGQEATLAHATEDFIDRSRKPGLLRRLLRVLRLGRTNTA